MEYEGDECGEQKEREKKERQMRKTKKKKESKGQRRKPLRQTRSTDALIGNEKDGKTEERKKETGSWTPTQLPWTI